MSELRPGDWFAVYTDCFLERAIVEVETIQEGNKAEYAHAGWILDAQGTTLEALDRVSSQNVFSAYKGDEIIFVRWKKMTPEAFQKGYEAVKGEIGQLYPAYRLPMILIGVGGIKTGDHEVCSELDDKEEIAVGCHLGTGNKYDGITPQMLVDEWKSNPDFEIVWEGILP